VYSTPSTTRPSLTGRSTRTPTQAMPSAFSWPVLVPSALRAPAPVNLGVRLFANAYFSALVLAHILTRNACSSAHRHEKQRVAFCPSACNRGSTIVAVVCRHELQFHPVSVWFQASSMASSNRHNFWCPDGPCYRRGVNVPPPRGRWHQGAIAEQQPSVIRNVVVTCAPALLGTWSTNAKQHAERARQYDLTGKEARQWQVPTISK